MGKGKSKKGKSKGNKPKGTTTAGAGAGVDAAASGIPAGGTGTSGGAAAVTCSNDEKTVSFDDLSMEEQRRLLSFMASSEYEGTAAAAEQFGSMSLGESLDRNDCDAVMARPPPLCAEARPPGPPEQPRKKQVARKSQKAGNEMETTAKVGTPTKLCSACGTKSDTLKHCNGCKCVWYCNKECQNKHRKEHKHECRRIKNELDRRGGKLDVGTEIDIGPLGKLLPREECPICMHVLPLHENLHAFNPCCGKTVCGSCELQHSLKNRERPTCPFCRTSALRSDEEDVEMLHKRIEDKDPTAMVNLAMAYGRGNHGLSVDQAKCIDLLHQSSGLGCPAAQAQIGNFYFNGDMGLEQNKEEALKYYEKAAEGGDVIAHHHLGCAKQDVGDIVASMRHWRLGASGGFKLSMEKIIVCFETDFLHHGDLAETLQAFYRARAEMKSKDRDLSINVLKMTGNYKKEFDL